MKLVGDLCDTPIVPYWIGLELWLDIWETLTLVIITGLKYFGLWFEPNKLLLLVGHYSLAEEGGTFRSAIFALKTSNISKLYLTQPHSLAEEVGTFRSAIFALKTSNISKLYLTQPF